MGSNANPLMPKDVFKTVPISNRNSLTESDWKKVVDRIFSRWGDEMFLVFAAGHGTPKVHDAIHRVLSQCSDYSIEQGSKMNPTFKKLLEDKFRAELE